MRSSASEAAATSPRSRFGALAIASTLPLVVFLGAATTAATTIGFVVPAPPSTPAAAFGVVARPRRTTTTSSTVVVPSASSSAPPPASSSRSSSSPSDEAEAATAPPPSPAAPPTTGGAKEFEAWFRSKPGTASTLRHGAFRGGRLRGLRRVADGGGETNEAMRLPRSLVLRAPYGSRGSSSSGGRKEEGRGGDDADDWDVELSLKLLEECARGDESELSGYCALLARGVPYDSVTVPPSVAPDALRHWTSEQREPLKSSRAGRRLLKALRRQTDRWNAEYDNLRNDRGEKAATRERFLWAMEAVHSRAFRGSFGSMRGGGEDDDSGMWKALASSLVPISLAAIGLNLLLNDVSGESSDAIAIVCGLVAFSPVLANTMAEGDAGGGGGDAVLLPFVDSANHLRRADSKIEYDPLGDAFTLSLGDNCFVDEDDGDGEKKTQVYISYGPKSDSELLLNYGFLPGVAAFAAKETVNLDDDDEREEEDARRARLAEAFLRRNP